MARTIQNLLADSRRLLQDKRASSYRHTDAELIELVNTAFADLYYVRPDVFIGCCSDGGTEIPQYTVADLELEIDFPLETQFYQPVLYHVVGHAELSNDEFNADGRAVLLLQAFRQQLRQG